MHTASSTENVKENAARHGLARWTKFSEQDKIFAEKLYPRTKIYGRQFFSACKQAITM